MFIIAAIEWVTNEKGHYSPTQLAAVRVNNYWKELASISTLIRPQNEQGNDWTHTAYTGALARDFLQARSAYNAFSYFDKWVSEDDIILWWDSKSAAVFNLLFSLILKKPNNRKSVCLNEYVREFLYGKANSRGGVYELAKARAIDVKAELSHCSANDIRVMRMLLSCIHYPQELLYKPLERKTANDSISYLYDDSTNKIHRKGCTLIENRGEQAKAYPNLTTAVRKGFKPCDCCKEDYQATLRARNQDIINRSQYTYLYVPGSKVFHRYTCRLMLNVKSISGARTYDNPAIQNRKPCKLCKPTPDDDYRPVPNETLAKNLLKKKVPGVPKEELVAMKRQRTAALEREELLKDNTISKQERDDVFTLTQPGFAFFAAIGYDTFHVKSCGKLQRLSRLKGFSRYQDAIKAGFSPCKKCKPTAKMDVKISIPITSKVRFGEKAEDLESLCIEAGYTYHMEENLFYLDTKVGKWIIELETAPIRLQHINLVVTQDERSYHKQPRVFLSYADAFAYIKRHDENLM